MSVRLNAFQLPLGAMLPVLLAVCLRDNARDAGIAQAGEDIAGTTVVVLVDFSKSFAPLQPEDVRAIEEVSEALTKLSQEWPAPIKVVWSKIQTESLLAQPLCDPIEFKPSLVKFQVHGEIRSLEDLESSFGACQARVAAKSNDRSELADYTDISGALEDAAEIAHSAARKVVVLMSDFHEELKPGARPASFALAGEAVVMVDRPSRNDRPNEYADRVAQWSRNLQTHGAAQVVRLPVFGVTAHRITESLQSTSNESGTSVSILIDPKLLPVPKPGGEARYRKAVLDIAQAVAEQARNWDSPVTATWVIVGGSPIQSVYFPPVEFSPRLVRTQPGIAQAKHRTPHLEEFPDFQRLMESCAKGIAAKYGRYISGDIRGTLTMALAATRPQESKIVVLFSDFVEGNPANAVPKLPLKNARVLMVYHSAPTDGSDPNARLTRIQVWKDAFSRSGAGSVCTVALEAATTNDFKRCL